MDKSTFDEGVGHMKEEKYNFEDLQDDFSYVVTDAKTLLSLAETLEAALKTSGDTREFLGSASHLVYHARELMNAVDELKGLLPGVARVGCGRAPGTPTDDQKTLKEYARSRKEKTLLLEDVRARYNYPALLLAIGRIIQLTEELTQTEFWMYEKGYTDTDADELYQKEGQNESFSDMICL